MGQKIANALRGNGDARWLPHLALWTMLVVGAIAGARAVIWSPPLAYGLAVLFSAGLAARAPWTRRGGRRGPAARSGQYSPQGGLSFILFFYYVRSCARAKKCRHV